MSTKAPKSKGKKRGARPNGAKPGAGSASSRGTGTKHAARKKKRGALQAEKARARARARRQRRKDGTAGPSDEQMAALPTPRGEGSPKRKHKPKPKPRKGAWREERGHVDDRPKTKGPKSRSAGKPRNSGKSAKFGGSARFRKSDKQQEQLRGPKSRKSAAAKAAEANPHRNIVAPEERSRNPRFTPTGPPAHKSAKARPPAAVKTAGPPPAVGTFGDLHGVHVKTAEALAATGLTHPFPIQTAVIPSAARGKDMLVQSPTGSGKTLAFGLPLIERIPARTDRPLAVVLAPTRELAVQVCADLAPIAKGKGLTTAAVYGGAPIAKQAAIARRAAIVVATPGRLADLMRTRRINLSEVRMLVLDEADRMLDMGFQPQVDEIVDELPRQRQTLLFSATLEGAVGAIARKYTDDPEIVRNAHAVGAGGKISHVLMATSTSTKVDTVLDALDTPDRDLAVVFVRTKRGADRLNSRLRDYGLRSTTIHGGMTQHQRLREYERFQNGAVDILVATDVFARGMDLDRITHVINYDLPEDGDTYRHRTGRTGRAGRAGTAISMVLPNQRKAMKQLLRGAGLPAEINDNYVQPSGIRRKPLTRKQLDKAAAKRPATGNHTQGLEGEIASYHDDKGFGFITPDGGGSDVFFHRSALGQDQRFSIKRGAPVRFDLDPDADRGRAASVELSAHRRERRPDRGPQRSGGGRPRKGGRTPTA